MNPTVAKICVLILLTIFLFPVMMVAAPVYKLLELAPWERRAVGLGAALGGVIILAAVNFSFAGPGFVGYATVKWISSGFVHAFRVAAAELRGEEAPEKDVDYFTGYFALPRVTVSSLGWGLAAGGLTFALRRKKRGAPGSSLFEKRREKRVAEMRHPPDGALLGTEKGTGKPVIITDREANQHVFLVGTTGSGKTTTLMNFVESAVTRGLPLVLVDGKGDPAFAGAVKILCERHGRDFRRFSMRGPSCRYDPLAHGGVTELKDKLLYLTEWSEPHYEALAGRYLQFVFRVFERAVMRPDLAELGRHLDPDALAGIIRRVADRQERADMLELLDTFKTGEIRGLAARLAQLTESEIGHLFRRERDVIDLYRAILEGQVVVFSLDSLAYPEYSRLLGRLIVADIKCAAARAYQERRRLTYCIFDEFNVFCSPAVMDLIGKARGAEICAIIATQSLSDIEAAAGKAVVNQIVDNCNTFIIQRQNAPESAETLADVVGTREGAEVTRQVQSIAGITFDTGLGSVRRVREYVAHPDEIKDLKTGEAIVARKLTGEVLRVKVRKCWDNTARQARKP
ncbi:MAG: helicase HerA-like domain-containing protein [Bacillota bacterium]